MSSWSIHCFLCLGGLRRLSRRTCWAGGCPARSRARRRASFAALYFLRDFFLATVWVKRQNLQPRSSGSLIRRVKYNQGYPVQPSAAQYSGSVRRPPGIRKPTIFGATKGISESANIAAVAIHYKDLECVLHSPRKDDPLTIRGPSCPPVQRRCSGNIMVVGTVRIHDKDL